LALAVYTTSASGVPVSILLYAFLFDYMLRLGSIQLLHGVMTSRTPTLLTAIAPLVTRQPAVGQQSHPVTRGEGGPAAPIGSYLLVLAVLLFFAFVMMNVNADQEIDLTIRVGVRDLWWALLIGAIYWINSLLTRTMVIHPRESAARNFGYNSKELTILALAVLTGGVVVGVRQNMGLEASGWTVMGPLLFFRFLYDVLASLESVRAKPIPGVMC
jgi:hypothetical protein